MIRGFIAFWIVVLVVVMCFCFMARCTSCVVCAPASVPDAIYSEPIAAHKTDWEKYRRELEERRKRRQEDEERQYGKPYFILE